MKFVPGAIHPELITEEIVCQREKTKAGAFNFFLGQVRADQVGQKIVSGIEFSAYESMAIKKFKELYEGLSKKFGLDSLTVYHSLNLVNAGEICIFLMLAAPRRRQIFEATGIALEKIKSEMPIFGKELFKDKSRRWKINHND